MHIKLQKVITRPKHADVLWPLYGLRNLSLMLKTLVKMPVTMPLSHELGIGPVHSTKSSLLYPAYILPVGQTSDIYCSGNNECGKMSLVTVILKT